MLPTIYLNHCECILIIKDYESRFNMGGDTRFTYFKSNIEQPVKLLYTCMDDVYMYFK